MVAIRIVLVSACLTGLRTRYDGRTGRYGILMTRRMIIPTS